MELKAFFDNFEIMAEAPDGTQKLREMILQLAVQGKLVPQDPKDEPASSLLDQIESENKQRVNGNRRSVPVPVDNEDQPFELPEGWVLQRVGHILVFEYGKGLPKETNTSTGSIPAYGANGIKKYCDRAYVSDPVIIVGRKGTAGAVNKVYEPCWPLDVTYFIRPAKVLCFEFVFQLLKSLRLEGLAKGIKPGLNRNEAYNLLIGLPPAAEQQRIVAKVDEFMALCDDLETRKQKAHHTCILLNDAAISKLLTAPTPAKFSRHWRRIADNFDLFYGKPENVSKLRQAILQLAVQGKLVKQDPKDEPALVLLEKIYQKRCKWIDDVGGGYKEAKTVGNKISRIRKKPVQPPSELIPGNWSWSTVIEACCLVVDCHNKTAPYVDKGIKLVRTTNIRRGEVNFINIKYVNKKTYDYWSRRCPPLPGDILLTREAPVGEAAIIPENEMLCMGQRMMLLRPFHDLMLKEYLLIALLSSDFLHRLEGSQIGATVKHLRVGDVEKAMIAIPPLREQKRIVAKVDQLMALCDDLEAKLVAGQDKNGKLLEAAVAEMVAA